MRQKSKEFTLYETILFQRTLKKKYKGFHIFEKGRLLFQYEIQKTLIL